MSERFAAAILAVLAAGCADDDAAPPADAGPDGPSCLESPAAGVAGCASVVGTRQACEGQAHVADGTQLVWSTNPPASGSHYPEWERERGEHTEAVPRGNWVHNLEHGWVVLLHSCSTACEGELAVLREATAERPDARVLMTPDPLLDPPRFAAVSWTWIYETDAPDLDTLLCFIDQHEGQAPEDVH